MTKDPYRPRRAYKLWWWPMWLRITLGILINGLMLAIGIAIGQNQQPVADASEPTVKIIDRVVAVPQMPKECYALVAASEELAGYLERDIEMTGRMADQFVKQDYAEVLKIERQADQMNKGLHKAYAEVLKQQKRCENPK